ncbi:flagellin [Phenylobacterium sp.]|jgi:flagellar hook-associated protein 3 FlgL|uniref:flagellin n=1 Tax=Phenylobacterium sp. TaxID=1871053 RepID=UPI002E30D3C1|nr:flagellin [Phenylobacterium sp.]HEX2558745.1 flagellin [Phenylobacterium sp.]
MVRIATTTSYSAVLANLTAAQKRQLDAGDRLASQKNGDDLKDYAKNAEMLTAMRTVHTRTEGYLSQNVMLSEKLIAQDSALTKMVDAATRVRQRITDALATKSGEGLMLEIEAEFRTAMSGLNAKFAGKSLFAGGQININPVSAQTMADLTAPLATIPGFFHNDDFKVQARLDESTTETTGFLAEELGTGMLTAFRDMQAFEEGATGNFGAQLTQAQETFLTGQLAAWEQVTDYLIEQTARNGMVQKRVEDVGLDLARRRDMTAGMIGNIVDADMAKAASDLSQAEFSVQAAAQVFATLRESSLLNVLRS